LVYEHYNNAPQLTVPINQESEFRANDLYLKSSGSFSRT
jgi:hypothetical protein